MYNFPQTTLLVTHYNRSKSLENLLRSFASLGCEFKEIIVSDDGSRQEHFQYIKELQESYPFEIISTPKNKGLGNNINKGQDVIKTPYTLYVQEDFEPTSDFPEKLQKALGFFEIDTELDYVRFYAYLAYPYLKPYSDGFSEMLYKPFGGDYNKVYYYSDHPHLRRSSFFEKFGRYQEGIKVELTEYKMCISFIQNKGKGLFYNDYKKLFIQRNTVAEPSTVFRDSWKRSNNYFIALIRDLYRQIKYNYDILRIRSVKQR